MNTHDKPQDRADARQANGHPQERRYARRIDCTERPRPPQPAANPSILPAPHEDAHR